MKLIDKAVPIQELGQRNLWVLYGKSGSGKTYVGSTFPKPLLYVRVGDDGSNTISNVEGINAIAISTIEELKQIAKDVVQDKEYKTVLVDTFSLLTNEWIDENVIKKKKRMIQQTWGDLKTDTEELIKLFHKAAKKKIIVLNCHETTDSIEGMEDEITPDVRPNITKGARTYLEAMANYGIHLTKVKREVVKDGISKEVVKYAAHLSGNPFYWTKFQVSPEIKLPELMINPSYEKIMKIIEGGN
jgi:hypothetical protein